VIFATGTEPDDFTLPTLASGRWGKWLLRAVVDGETDSATALEILSPRGLHATPAGEESQFGGAAQRWAKHLEENWRSIEAGLGTGGGGGGDTVTMGGDVSGSSDNCTVARLDGVPVDLDGVTPGSVLVTQDDSGTKIEPLLPPELAGAVLTWNGGALEWSAPLYPDLEGDVQGTPVDTTVTAIQGVPVDLGTPADGQLLVLQEDEGVKVKKIAAPSSEDSLLRFKDGGGIAWDEAPSLNLTTRFAQYLGHQGSGLQFGADTVSVTGIGTVALTTGQCEQHVLRLTGALTGDRTVTLPAHSAGAGRVHTLINATTGDYLLRVEGPSGGAFYLLPGQSRRVVTDDAGVLRGEALDVLELVRTITLTGDTDSADVVRVLCKLPPRVIVERVELLTLEAASDAGHLSSVGTVPPGVGPGYDDLIARQVTPGTSDPPLGWAAATLGAGMSTEGSAYFASAETVRHVSRPDSGTLTTGQVRIHLTARYLGE
jgi:hypothetical protein